MIMKFPCPLMHILLCLTLKSRYAATKIIAVFAVMMNEYFVNQRP